MAERKQDRIGDSLSEARRYLRAVPPLDVSVALSGGLHAARVRDISRAGICFFYDRPIAIMTVLDVTITIGGAHAAPITGRGAVVRCQRVSKGFDHYEIAVFLHDMNDENRQLLDDFAHSPSAGRGSPRASQQAEAVQRADVLPTDTLRLELRIEPFDSHLAHPGEQALENCFVLDAEGAVAWLFNFVSNREDTESVITLLLLLGRMHLPPNSETRALIITQALHHQSVGVRNAAIEASDMWQDRALQPVLVAHIEPVPWLAAYKDRVASQIGR